MKFRLSQILQLKNLVLIRGASPHKRTVDLLSYSIASGIQVTLTRVKCWNINHQNHKHTFSHEVHDQNDRSNRCNTLYGCDDWYFSIWHVSMSLEFHWQLSNWVGLLCRNIRKTWPCDTFMQTMNSRFVNLQPFSREKAVKVQMTCRNKQFSSEALSVWPELSCGKTCTWSWKQSIFDLKIYTNEICF